ncbi:hypothetical protein V6Z12_D09G038900 [Gossypium hirsutum]
MWPDSRGVLWRDILRENARKEFEEARFEKDPEVVTRLLIGGRDAVESALEKLAEKQRHQIQKERGDALFDCDSRISRSWLMRKLRGNQSSILLQCSFVCWRRLNIELKGGNKCSFALPPWQFAELVTKHRSL